MAPPLSVPEEATEAPMHLDAEAGEDGIFEGIFAMEEPPHWTPPAPEASAVMPLPDRTLARRLRAVTPPLLPGTAAALALQRDRLALLHDRISPP